MIKEVFAKIDKLEEECNALHDKQMELYQSLDLDNFSKEDIFHTIRNCQDNMFRIYLADYFRQRFKMNTSQYSKVRKS